MAVDPIDTAHLGDLFGTAEMRAVFDETATIERYLEVEKTLARVEAQLGVIPEEAAEAIAGIGIDDLDLGEYAERVAVVGFPIAPLVDQLARLVGNGYGEYAHWGATTQDIMDTALVLQLRDAIAILERDLASLSAILAALAAEHESTQLAGRSQLQQALPITFGFKAATWLAAIDRHRRRLQQAKPRILTGQLGGAVGSLAALHPDGLKVRDALCADLGLRSPEITWHTTRDSLTEFVLFLANLTTTLAKIGTDLVLMAQTEVGEIREPWVPGRGTSSTMPQKRNPVGSALLRTIAVIVRSEAIAMLDAGVQDHERATGTWVVEWLAIPRSTVLTAGALDHAIAVLGGLEVDAAAMEANLATTAGLISAEAVMMRLARSIGRQHAHDLVAVAARTAADTGSSFAEALAANDEIAGVLSRDEIEQLLRPESYIGHATSMVEAVLREDADVAAYEEPG